MFTKDFTEQNKKYAIALRREFHRHPELGGREFETAKRIEAELDALGIEHHRVAATNVVGIIRGEKAGRTIGLRSDIDALPVTEETGVSYCSETPGMMHACGHDGHMAALLLAARTLLACRGEMQGTVKLLFQSAEEPATGARELIEAGELEDVDALFGIHIWNDVEHGTVYVSGGEQMASPIEFRVSFKGKGAHGSMPYMSLDATLPMAALIMHLQSLVSMEFSAMSNVVLSVTRAYSGPNAFIEHGRAFNVIADTSYLEGTVRTFNEEDTERFRQKMQRMVKGVAETYGVEGELFYNPHCPPVINDPGLAELARKTCVSLWGEESLDHELGKVMAGEDFGEYCRLPIPTLFAFVGSRNTEKLPYYPHHNPKFNIDEDAIAQAACLHAQFALDFLRQTAEWERKA